MTSAFLVQHTGNGHHDEDPIDVVRNDRAVCGGILPAEESVEDIPTIVDFRVATVDVPNGLGDIV